ncbi:MAG: hypothetical protein ABJH68_03645 [Ilumatobacter sp.]|uniref:hypothetical protein n=1 Tax=Ilumatobacter sp. TaxID=1967498 RepID=UPI003296C78A
MARISGLLAAGVVVCSSVLIGVGAAPATVTGAGEAFAPLASPQRIADTRPVGETVDGRVEKTGPVAAGRRLELQVAGRAGVASDATAVVLNVTVLGSQNGGFVTVYPCDQPLPNGSNINYRQGQVIANAVFARLDPSGRTCIHTSATAQLVVDVTGSLPGDSFATLAAPARLLDTRPIGEAFDDDARFEKTGRLGAGDTFTLQVAGRAGIPADATIAVLNVAAIAPDGGGFITMHPCDQRLPNASNVNYAAGQVVANSVVARLDAAGRTCIFTSSTTNLLVDATGTLAEGAYAALQAPARVYDSRPNGETVDDVAEKTLARRPGTTLQLPIAGRAGVPANATAVVLNVTVARAQTGGFVTVHPRNSTRPNAANLNHAAGEVIANSVVAKLGGNGEICMFTSAFTEMIVDVAGYFTGPVAADTGENCPFEFPAYVSTSGVREDAHQLVGEFQMPPGRYVGTGIEADQFGRCDVFKYAFFGDLFSADDGSRGDAFSFQNSRLIIDVLPTDRFVRWDGYDCTPLLPYEPGAFAPVDLNVARGTHVVGDHIAPGTYSLDSGNCDFERLRSFTGRRQLDRISLTQSLFEGRGVQVTVLASDVGVRMSVDCRIVRV